MSTGTGYKLTEKDGRTRNDTLWGPGVTHTANGKGPLCTEGWIHFYDHPVLAVLLNPIHGKFAKPRLWRIEWSGETLDDRGLKRGATSVTTLEEISLPQVTIEQRVEFAIRCAMVVCGNKEWLAWAESWLSGADRSAAAAKASLKAAQAAGWVVLAAASAAEEAAAWAAEAAEEWAARAAAAAVASAAMWTNGGLDLVGIAEQVCKT